MRILEENKAYDFDPKKISTTKNVLLELIIRKQYTPLAPHR